MDYEQQLRQNIQAGKLDDKQISDIINHGDRTTKRMLDKKVDEQKRAKEHYARVNGVDPKSFDGIDDRGRPFKDMQVKL